MTTAIIIKFKAISWWYGALYEAVALDFIHCLNLLQHFRNWFCFCLQAKGDNYFCCMHQQTQYNRLSFISCPPEDGNTANF
jgi:hypothetical protein